MGIDAAKAIYEPFSEDELVRLKRKDTKNYFTEELIKLCEYIDFIKEYKKFRKIPKDAAEYNVYEDVYEEYAQQTRTAMEYIAHFDYVSSKRAVQRDTQAKINEHFKQLDDLKERLKQLDEGYSDVIASVLGDGVDMSFWENYQYDGTAEKRLAGFRVKRIIIAGCAIVALSIGIVGAAGLSNKLGASEEQVTETVIEDNVERHSLVEWFDIIHEGIEPCELNTITLTANDYDIVLGKTSIADLADAGYSFSVADIEYDYNAINEMLEYYDVESPDEAGVAFKQLHRDMGGIAPGKGSVEIGCPDETKMNVSFYAYQNVDKGELDLSKAYVYKVNFDSANEVPEFEFCGVTNESTIDEIKDIIGTQKQIADNVENDSEFINFYMSYGSNFSVKCITKSDASEGEVYQYEINALRYKFW